jgi:hypothetical protein
MGCAHGRIGGCNYGHAMGSIGWVNLKIKSDCISRAPEFIPWDSIL